MRGLWVETKIINEWKTDTFYKKGDVVVLWTNIKYTCLRDHKSNIFLNDVFDNFYWERVI